jgi:hypothetical protein
MIQKYVISDSIILLPAIAYADKDLYSYEWYINGVLHDINYYSKYNFPKSGIYTIKLVTTNNITKLATTIIKQVNVTLKGQKCIIPDTPPPPPPPPPPPAPVVETFTLKTLYGDYNKPDIVIIPHDGGVCDYYVIDYTNSYSPQAGGCDFGPDGNLYIAYYTNIIKYDLTKNTISSFAGSNSEGSSDGNGASARFADAVDCKWGTDGYLYVVERSIKSSYKPKIRKISQSADVTTLAILGTPDTMGLAVHPISHDVYVSDFEANLIYKVTQAGVVSTVAGREFQSGDTGSQEDGTGTDALFDGPFGMAFDSTGSNLYIIQQNGHNIRKMTVPGYVVTTPVGPTDESYGDVDGTGSKVRLHSPQRITRYSDTVFYITDSNNYKTKKFDPSTNNVTTFCLSTRSEQGQPWGLAANSMDSLYVTKEYQALQHEYYMTDMNNLRFTGLSGIDVDSNGVLYTSSTNGLIITGSNYSDFGTYNGDYAVGPLFNVNTKMRDRKPIYNPNTNELYVNNYYCIDRGRAFLEISGGNLKTVNYIITSSDLSNANVLLRDMKFNKDYTKIYFIDEDEEETVTRLFMYTIATNTLSAPIITYPISTATMVSVLDASDGNLYIITSEDGITSGAHCRICKVNGTNLTEIYGFDLNDDKDNAISDFREYKPGKFLILGSRQIFKYVLETNTFTAIFGNSDTSGSVDGDQNSSTLIDARGCSASRPYNNKIYFCNQNSIRFVQWT